MRTITRLSLSSSLFVLTLLPQLAAASVVSVSVLDNSYSPQNVSIQPGDTVVWTNYGSQQHTIVADNNSFTSSTLSQGVNFSYTFNAPGTYTYHDATYATAGMTGSVTVLGGSIVPSGYPTTVKTSGSSASSLQAQAQALLQQISQLQVQLAGGGGSSTTVINSSNCPNIGRTLKLGSSGSDVSRLQIFLAQDPSVYPQGTVSGYYGALTQAAVSRWQVKYNIVSSGSPATTGWGVVGPRTAAAIALLCSTGSTTGSSTGTGTTVSTPTAPTVGGTIQVTPISGNAPLTVSVQATLNTVASCTSATYVLNFGDGTQSTAIPVAQNTCQPITQNFTHTYQYGGTYTIVLAAGTHQTTALVTVNGPLSPSAAAASGIPADSLSASITSGAAPLTVAFTGTVSSLSSFACSGTCTDTINFGDGTIGLVQIPTTSGTWQSYVISHTYATAGTYQVQLKSATGAADGSPITITVTAPASFSATPTSGTAALNVSFNGNNISAGTTNQINFGDGTTGNFPLATSCSSGSLCSGTVNHTYTSAGTYTATLTSNGTSVGTVTITVAAPSADSNSTSSGSYGIITLTPKVGGNPLAVAAQIALPSCASYQINWGDSSSVSTQTAACTTGGTTVTVNHTYAGNGTYTISLNDGSGSAKSSASISISN